MGHHEKAQSDENLKQRKRKKEREKQKMGCFGVLVREKGEEERERVGDCGNKLTRQVVKR